MESKKLLVTIIVIFAVIIGIQSYYMFEFKKELVGLKRNTSTEISQKQSQNPNVSSKQENWSPFSEDWDPFRELEQVRKEINHVFDNSLSRGIRSPHFKQLYTGRIYTPDVDFNETDKQYIVKIDIPGMDETNIDVQIKNNMLIVTGQRNKEAEESKKGKYYWKERSYGYFSRSIPLPEDIDAQKMTTEYKNGVLITKILRQKVHKNWYY